MASTVTLQQLRDLARFYADERPDNMTGYLPDTEVNMLLNKSLAGIYDRLVAARGHDHYSTTSSVAVVAGTAGYALPTDFFEALEFYLTWGTRNNEPVEPCETREALAFTDAATWGQNAPKAYRIVGDTLTLYPTPTSAVTGTLVYVPAFQKLTSDADTFDGVNGWDQAVALEVAADMMMLQDKQHQHLLTRRDEVLARIDAMAADRIALYPRRVIDCNPEGVRASWPERLPRP